jgi:alkyldihydroxyacetonephosphate synthase
MPAAMTQALEALRSIPGAPIVETSADALASRTRDWWPLPRLREVRGEDLVRPEAVITPANTDEVSRVMRWATEHHVVVVPRGLGSGVCGGVVPPIGAVVLETSQMDAIDEIDELSYLVRCGAGIRGDILEAELNQVGLSLGHSPQSMALSSPGGWIATSSAGQATPGYGSIEDHLVGYTLVMADGTVMPVRPMPRNAAGPDLRKFIVGWEGRAGIVTEVVLSLVDYEPESTWVVHRYPDFAACLAAARDIRRSTIGPRVLRGWDAVDTSRAFGESYGIEAGVVGVVGLPASAAGLGGRVAAIAEIAERHGGATFDPGLGQHWFEHRFDAVETFDDVMGPRRTMGSGVVLDTLEVSALWRDIDRVHEDVTAAFAAESEIIGCHFSHVYVTGAALYFTFVLRDADDVAVEQRYLRTWSKALEVCVAAGGSIAHHHGVGRLKTAAFAKDVGEPVIELLRRLDQALDPDGLLNPGALLPDD